jgi:hypothetical protein
VARLDRDNTHLVPAATPKHTGLTDVTHRGGAATPSGSDPLPAIIVADVDVPNPHLEMTTISPNPLYSQLLSPVHGHGSPDHASTGATVVAAASTSASAVAIRESNRRDALDALNEADSVMSP